MTQIAHEQPAFAPVGFFERLLAYIIDFVILLGIQYGLHLLLGDDRPFFDFGTTTQSTETGGQASVDFRPVDLITSFLVPASYFIGSWCLFAATPGKLIMGFKIVHAETGEPIDGGAAVLRYIGSIISGIVLCLGYLWIIWDPKKQGWHDKIANTIVIRTR
jgi:uncharacterized RDD family membrane protein YckC